MTPPPIPPDDTETGLPLLRSWAAVYVCVVAAFCVWVVGLLALPLLFK